jgi:hypothetical protein
MDCCEELNNCLEERNEGSDFMTIILLILLLCMSYLQSILFDPFDN